MAANGTDTQGWTSSPDGRGTYDIIFSSLATTFLCCWTSVYPSIPAPSDGRWTRLRDKLGLACLGIAGPDFLIALTMSQKSSARRSVKKFKAAGYHNWTPTHAFFADMGGFTLKAPGLENPIPLSAEQVFYLVQNNYLKYPGVTKREIDDRDKSDGLARFVAVLQAAGFFINVVARAIEGLTVTAIEFTTISFIAVLFGTAWAWKDKPSDVLTTICLETSVPLDEIVADAGRADAPYYHTPLDFIDRYEDPFNLMWQYYNDLLRRIWFSPFSRRVKKKPWDRIPSDSFPKLDMDLGFFGSAFILVFSSIYMAAWNSYFPSAIERDAWRAASIYMVSYSVLGLSWFFFWMYIIPPEGKSTTKYELSLFEESLPRQPLQIRYGGIRRTLKQRRHAEDTGSTERLIPPKHTAKGIWYRLLGVLSTGLNISPDKDPHLSVPIGLWVPTTVLASVYCIFRLYILTENIIALRSLPSDAYDTVSWSSFIPQI